MSKILVTGATGTVGRQVAATLAAAGASVRAAVRDPAKATDLAEAGAEVIEFDFTSAASVSAALEGVDRVFLLTPFVEDAKPLVRNVVEAAKAAGVKFILRMSAAGGDPNAELSLAREHGLAEQIVKDSGVSWSVIQPTFFMDNVINYAKDTILAEGKMYGSAGAGRTSYVSTSDIAAVAAAILQDPQPHEGKTHSLTGAEAYSEQQVADLAGEIVGKPVQYVSLEPEQQRAAMEGMGMPAWMIEGMIGLEAVKRNGWAQAVSPVVESVLQRPPETFAGFLDRNRERLKPA